MKKPQMLAGDKGPNSQITPKDFTTSNPRQVRALVALLKRPQPRESIDCTAGAANGPALISDMRSAGLEIPCERIRFIDRDGHLCRPGVYSLSRRDRLKVRRWLARRT